MLQCKYAIIGGSSTYSINFPADLKFSDCHIREENLVFETPFGESPPLTLCEVRAEEFITCKMHGWRNSVSRGTASQQLFWVFKEVGVKTILAEGGVGCLHENVKPGNIVVPHDYVDFSLRKGISLGQEYLLIMRDPLCPDLRAVLIAEAQKKYPQHVIPNGIYAVTEGRHFESRAEISLFAQWHIDIVGQSLVPEVYLAREIGACYAGIYLVVNHAEGIAEDWSHAKLKELFYTESKKMGQVLLNTLQIIMQSKRSCSCSALRKPTLLK